MDLNGRAPCSLGKELTGIAAKFLTIMLNQDSPRPIAEQDGSGTVCQINNLTHLLSTDDQGVTLGLASCQAVGYFHRHYKTRTGAVEVKAPSPFSPNHGLHLAGNRWGRSLSRHGCDDNMTNLADNVRG